jgi:hypothetical protein
MSVFENVVLRRIFGPKRNEVVGGWRKLHNEELHNFSYPSIIRMLKGDEMGRVCSMIGEKKKVYRVLLGEPEGKRPLGRPRSMWVDNIKMDLREIGWVGMDYGLSI